MSILGGIGKDAGSAAVEAAGRVVDDIQANLTERLAVLRTLLAGHRIVIRIEIEEKEASHAPQAG